LIANGDPLAIVQVEAPYWAQPVSEICFGPILQTDHQHARASQNNEQAGQNQ
jgi:hypothetical protein